MKTDALKIKKDLEKIANEYDQASKVVIIARDQAGDAQASKLVTFGVMVQPDNEDLVNALVRYGIDNENEVRFIGSQVNLQNDRNLVDVIQVQATIFYKG